ncbi:glutamate-5-semialdehyde dehydrogenase [Loigolactobacillus backii]|uniref:glutamate-5-semialdehyde dehydrogenase n=1 Tax=Loigolactobacillus backii TaxID=375175 RepID=UPI000C1CBF57|nr:glutamate-5-semialdehyde dehydrogenase [Loigolactobacillus backii]PIO83723.1 glutamate-5-semialdehyde dehydrogenase [Loigolactobacillus backii]
MNLNEMGAAAKQAAFTLGQLATSRKDQVLNAMANALLANQTQLLQANAQDLATAKVKPSMLDRLKLDEDRIQAMATGLRQVANLPDPIGNIDGGFTNEAGLVISKQRVPLGVIGMIYEARPNVTVDAAALCFKSGNAVILRGGKEAIQSNQALTKILQDVLKMQALPEAAIQLVSDTSHETARALMQLNDYLDVLIPRGSGSFIKTVVRTATVPVIETGAGNCHIYVDESADLAMAVRIIVNAKTQRPSVCNAMEKLIINEKVAKSFLPAIAKALAPYQVELRGDTAARKILPLITPATEADWETEYNDYILAIKVVPDLASAINHINRYNTQHSEAIITNNYQHSVQFTQQIDAAVVYVNASTRFTDGFEFGFGAEIGISTQKLHARGPMGLRELTTTKYVVLGTGQIRE